MKSFATCKKIDHDSLKKLGIEDEGKRNDVLKLFDLGYESIYSTAQASLRDKIFDKCNYRMKYGIVRDEKRDLRNEKVTDF